MARGMLVVAYHFSGDMDNWMAGVMAIRGLLGQTNEVDFSQKTCLFWRTATCVLVDPNEVLKRLDVSMAGRTAPCHWSCEPRHSSGGLFTAAMLTRKKHSNISRQQRKSCRIIRTCCI